MFLLLNPSECAHDGSGWGDPAAKPASNKSYADWGAIFGDPIIATAILDRLLHHSTTLNIRGESYRLKDRRRAGLLGSREQEGGGAASFSTPPAQAPPKPRQKAALGSARSAAAEKLG